MLSVNWCTKPLLDAYSWNIHLKMMNKTQTSMCRSRTLYWLLHKGVQLIATTSPSYIALDIATIKWLHSGVTNSLYTVLCNALVPQNPWQVIDSILCYVIFCQTNVADMKLVSCCTTLYFLFLNQVCLASKI